MGFSNFYLTDQGATLLAKLQARKADIEFTKAAIGKGDVPAGTNIVTLTALVDQVKTLPIAGLDVASQQAQIKIQMTNADVPASFKWKEIGVFATDPDEGEILYIYGNAGEDADAIPAYSSGLNEFLFTIIAKIANGTSAKATFDKGIIYITQGERGVPGGVANEDDLTTHTFNQAIHITALTCKKSGTNFALAGTVPGTGIIPCQFIADVAYNSGDTFTVNETNYGVVPDNGGSMWTNTFPAGAVVSAKLDIANKKIHLNAMLTAAQVGASNPNLLINPCGNVNQRGQSVYTKTGYTVDRWVHGYTSGTMVIEVSQGGPWFGTVGERYIRLKVDSVNSPDTHYLAQYIEDNDNGYSPLAGETVTFSFLANPSNCSYRSFGLCWRDASNTYHQELKDILNSSGRYSITVTLPSGIRGVAVQIVCSRAITSADVGSYIDITEAKLEVGSVTTPFSPRTYPEELAMCQRYYQKFTQYEMGIVICGSTTDAISRITYPVKLRARPSIIQGISRVAFIGGAANNSAVYNVYSSLDGCDCYISGWTGLTGSAVGFLIAGSGYSDTDAFFSVDAEIY